MSVMEIATLLGSAARHRCIDVRLSVGKVAVERGDPESRRRSSVLDTESLVSIRLLSVSFKVYSLILQCSLTAWEVCCQMLEKGLRLVDRSVGDTHWWSSLCASPYFRYLVEVLSSCGKYVSLIWSRQRCLTVFP